MHLPFTTYHTTAVLGLPAFAQQYWLGTTESIQSADGPNNSRGSGATPKGCRIMQTAFYRMTGCLAFFLLHSINNTGSQCSASSVAASLLGLAAASPAMGKPKGRHGRIATGGVQAQCYMPRPRHHASFLMRQGPKLRCIARHANTRRRGDALTYHVNPESSDPRNTLKLCAGLRIWNPNHACSTTRKGQMPNGYMLFTEELAFRLYHKH